MVYIGGYAMEIYFNNELVAEEAKLNASTYIVKEEIKNIPKIFSLKIVEETEILEYKERATVIAHYETPEGWYLCFGEVDEKEYQIAKQQAQIEYLAMVLDEDIGE